jgi:hypothetical protein
MVLQKTLLIMSPEAVAALVGGALAVAGTLIGALVTLWLGPRYLRRLQRSGKVRYRLSDLAWNEKLTFADENPSLGHTFFIKVFNERGLGTGIRDVEVEFIDTKRKEIATDRPRDTWDGVHADFLNFPAQQWTVKRLMAGDLKYEAPEKMRKAKDCSKALLIARLPLGKEYEIEIPPKGKEPVEKALPGEWH